MKGYKTRLRTKSLGTPSTTVLKAHAKSPDNRCHHRQVPVKCLLPHSPPCTHFPVIPRHKGTADTQQHPVNKNVALHCCILSCSVEKGVWGGWKYREKHKIGHFYWVPWDRWSLDAASVTVFWFPWVCKMSSKSGGSLQFTAFHLASRAHRIRRQN